MKTLLEILKDSEGYLSQHGSESPRTDAEWLIAEALKLKRLDLYLLFDKPLQESELNLIRPLLKRRAKGEPVQYIIGNTPFYNVDISVGEGVLIPRPETEILVDLALKHFSGKGDVLDLCTGSGAILFAIEKACPDVGTLIGTDISSEALHWAAVNQTKLNSEKSKFLQGDLFAPLESGQSFELITANPPYIAENEREGLAVNVRDFEPEVALFAEDNGFKVIKKIIDGIEDFILPGGLFIMEIGETQADNCLRLFEKTTA